jgi:cysteine-rich repeat protein
VPICGDGIVDEQNGETCDPPGSPAGASGNDCREDCTVCGDGNVDPGEACDDGNKINDDGCSTDCRLEDICDLNVTKTAEPDIIIPEPSPSCENQEKPHTLIFKYTGGGCAASDNNQAPGRAVCTGSVDTAASISIIAGSEGLGKLYTVVPTSIAPGEEFSITSDGKRLSSSSQIDIANSGGTESNLFHASCSQPLAVGDVFGSLTLVGFNGQRDTSNEVTYTYEVTNSGDNLINVTVNDDRLGLIAEIPLLATGETQTFTRTVEITETTTNIATVSGTLLAPAPPCEANDTATVTIQEPQGSCDDGIPTQLVFRYTGEDCSASNHSQSSSSVTCSGDPAFAEPVSADVTTEDIVVPDDQSINVGDTITLIGQRSQGHVAPNTEFEIRQGGTLLQTVEFHTSCSQPLEIGDQFGSLLLLQFIN